MIIVQKLSAQFPNYNWFWLITSYILLQVDNVIILSDMTRKNSNYLIFVDESGDHHLNKYPKEFPMFVLAFVIITKDEYCDHLLPRFSRLRLKYFPDVSTIFHEREIRKAEKRFSFLTNAEKFLKSRNDFNYTTVTFESRAYSIDSYRQADEQLYKYFKETAHENFGIEIHIKSAGGLGLQFADLIARPIGIHVLRPEQPNRAWEIIKEKIIQEGLVVLPKK